jgi:hypothetical protein
VAVVGQFFIYLCMELKSQWPITAQIQTPAVITQHMDKKKRE